MDKEKIENILESTVKESAGCTEAVAIGIATSAAYNSIIGNYPRTTQLNKKGEFEKPNKKMIEYIKIIMDKNVFKNAYGVAVPNTVGGKGIKVAAALGLFADINKYYKSEDKPNYLKIFEQFDPDTINVEDLNSIIKNVSVEIDFKKLNLFISVELKYGSRTAKVTISGKHDNIIYIEVDKKKIYEAKEHIEPKKKIKNLTHFTYNELFDIIDNIKEKDVVKMEELQESIDKNKLLLQEGLLGNYGMGVVKIFKNLLRKGIYQMDILTQIKLQVAAGVEARMGGSSYPAMSTSGSGNMGITATIPIIVAGEYYNVEKSRVLKSILLSHLVVRMASDYIGELSPLCGNANKSAFGAAAGLTYLLGGNKEEVSNAIKYVASNIVGIVCDGAKYGCALKAMTAATVAFEAALFALEGIKIPSDGIVGESVEETFKNLGKLSHSIRKADDMIVKIILEKEKNKK